jgi:hypothetical protein
MKYTYVLLLLLMSSTKSEYIDTIQDTIQNAGIFTSGIKIYKPKSNDHVITDENDDTPTIPYTKTEGKNSFISKINIQFSNFQYVVHITEQVEGKDKPDIHTIVQRLTFGNQLFLISIKLTALGVKVNDDIVYSLKNRYFIYTYPCFKFTSKHIRIIMSKEEMPVAILKFKPKYKSDIKVGFLKKDKTPRAHVTLTYKWLSGMSFGKRGGCDLQ